MSEPIRVLIVDDSAFARKVMREILEQAEGMEVVGTARDGLDALEKVAELRPDVLTLDLVMPNLDGLGFLRALPSVNRPRVVLVTMSDVSSDLVARALEAGALDVIHKPSALATERLYELGAELVAKVRIAAHAKMPLESPRTRPRGLPAPQVGLEGALRGTTPASSPRLVVVGTSTGGPQALTHLLAGLPAGFPIPIAIALHIPVGYTAAIAERLNAHCALEVLEAYDGIELCPGRAVLARAGMLLKLERAGERIVGRLDSSPVTTPHRPSVDVLFESAAQAMGKEVLGVVLTGMGSDGAEGARAIHLAGGSILTESESSCVVYGMPRTVVEAGLSAGSFAVSEMAEAILRKARLPS